MHENTAWWVALHVVEYPRGVEFFKASSQPLKKDMSERKRNFRKKHMFESYKNINFNGFLLRLEFSMIITASVTRSYFETDSVYTTLRG
jgi:hypothetical protein